MSLNAKERGVLAGLSEAVRQVIDLLMQDPCHPHDLEEVVPHVHAVQNILLARGAVRDHLDQFTHLDTFCGDGTSGAVCLDDHQEVNR